MAHGRRRRPGSYSIRVETREGYMRRMEARQSRALVTGRLNTYLRMEYFVLPPILPMFGCNSLGMSILLFYVI